MQTHIQKWGNSLGIRIPMKFSHDLNLKAGSLVNVMIEDHRLVILPQRYTLEEMLTGITEDNLHHETLAGNLTGQEEW
jgi:antitoxin MazE